MPLLRSPVCKVHPLPFWYRPWKIWRIKSGKWLPREDILYVLQSPVAGGIGKLLNQIAKNQNLIIWFCFLCFLASRFFEAFKYFNWFQYIVIYHFISIYPQLHHFVRVITGLPDWVADTGKSWRKQEVCNLDWERFIRWLLSFLDFEIWKMLETLPYVTYSGEKISNNLKKKHICSRYG